MSPNKRIALNVLATYGRSVYALVIGLFSGRWILMALGKSDYGLVGLIGGLVAFVSFFNAILESAVGRFYAVGVGSARAATDSQSGVDECIKWFNTALTLYTVLPVILMIIGYPLGIWAIRNILSIPDGRGDACVWIWRFTCSSCFVAMLTVPFKAMFTARQEIAELTLYGVAATTCNAIFLYFMVTHPGYWLVKYSAWSAAISILPQVLITIRAVKKYQECRFVSAYLVNWPKIYELARYSAARFWSDFSNMISTQGQAVLVNRNMGVDYNASMAIGSTVAAHTVTLASSLSGAFWPAIANKCGENKYDDVMRLQEMASRIGAALVLMFALPLSLEIDSVLRLWLVNPPPFSNIIVVTILFRMAFLRMTDGYWMAILGSGRGVMRYSWTIGWAEIGLVVVAAIGFFCGCGMWSIVWGYLFSAIGCVLVRLWYGKVLLGIEIGKWLLHVMVPLVTLSICVLGVGVVVRMLMQESFSRILVLSFVCEVAFCLIMWKCVLKASEREYVLSAIDRMRRKFQMLKEVGR